MRTTRFLLSVTILTSFLILYVYQQSEIYRLGYTIQKQQEACQELLENNNLLSYNICRNSSITYIGSKLFQRVDFQMPDAYRLVKVEYPQAGIKPSSASTGKQSLLARIFGIKTEAQAKTIGP